MGNIVDLYVEQHTIKKETFWLVQGKTKEAERWISSTGFTTARTFLFGWGSPVEVTEPEVLAELVVAAREAGLVIGMLGCAACA